MTITISRPAPASAPLGWRSRPGMLAQPSGGPSERHQVAIVLTIGDTHGPQILPVLGPLGITTIDRPFDDEALHLIVAMAPDLVVLVCEATRAFDIQTIARLAGHAEAPLLVIDAGGSDAGAVAALQNGADAVLGGYAAAAVIRATIVALLRRDGREESPAGGPAVLRAVAGGLTIDHDTFEIRDGANLLPFTPTEFKIVAHLAEHAGVIRTPSQIMAILHDYGFAESDARQTVRVYIRRIRSKLNAGMSASVEIVNFRSRGYRLQAAGESESFEPRAA